MTQSSSFTDKEHREGNRNGSSGELEANSGSTCIHCGNPIAGVPVGREGALCNACE